MTAATHEQDPKMESHPWPRIALVVLGGLICQFGLGYGYAYGHIQKDITEELGWSRTVFSSVRFPQMGMMAIASPIVGWALWRVGARPILVGAAVCLFLATWMLSEITQYWQFAAGAALQGVVAVGLGDVVVGAIVAQWVTRYRGIALGIVYAGSNIAGLLLSKIFPALTLESGWRSAIFQVGLGGALLMLPFAIWVLREPPRQAEATTSTSVPETPSGANRDLNLVAALRTRSFWILCLALASFFFVFVGVLDHLVISLTDAGLDRVEASAALGLLNGAGIVAKVGFGALADQIDRRHAMWLQCGVFAMFTTLLLALPSPAFGTAIVIGFGMAAASRDVIYPLIIDYCFGSRYLAEIYGAIMFLLFMGALGTLFAGVLFDALGDYRAVFSAYGAIATLALIGTFFLRDERAQLE